MNRVEVLIIDVHSAVCQALAARLRAVTSIKVIGATSDLTAGKRMAHNMRPDVILLELKRSLRDEALEPSADPIRAITELSASGASCVIVLTSYLDEAEKITALDAGARRYLLKDIDTARLVAEIEQAVHEQFALKQIQQM